MNEKIKLITGNSNLPLAQKISDYWFLGNLDYAGSTYILIGRIPLPGYMFESQSEAPLTFKLVNGEGFMYLLGRGKTIGKEGKVTELGK